MQKTNYINKDNIKSKSNLKKSNQKIKSKELKVLCKQMSILLKSGCEITRILNILYEQSNKKLKRAIEEVSINIQNGNNITESFEKTNLFSSFFVNMLQAGELSGNLDKIMNDLAKYYDSEERLKSKIISISIYPIILIIMSMVSGFFILVFILVYFSSCCYFFYFLYFQVLFILFSILSMNFVLYCSLFFFVLYSRKCGSITAVRCAPAIFLCLFFSAVPEFLRRTQCV